MMRRTVIACTLLGGLASAAVALAEEKPAIPPPNAMKLSDIVATVETRSGFQYVYTVEWNEDGYYDVIYFTDDKAKVEMKLDPVTGKAK
jgi:Peptidase propeptide and YPEB domain